jgi:integrase
MGQHRKSIVKEAVDRLEGKMAIGQSRGEAKKIAREEAGGHLWAFSTGQIHSFKTRTIYQQHVVRFVRWARSSYQIKCLEQLDPRANELATKWLCQQLTEGKSPYTLQAERAALRLFFDNRTLASDVAIPRRAREQITRSRSGVVYDEHINPESVQSLIGFIKATGLRREEVNALHVADIIRLPDGRLEVYVANGKGGKSRNAPVLPGREQDVLQVIEGRAPDARIFSPISKHFFPHVLRRQYAQALYLHYAPGRALPPATGRLRAGDYDREAALRVSGALGHNRIDVVLRHYLR